MRNICKNIFFALASIALFISTTCTEQIDWYGDCTNLPEQIIGTGLIVSNALIPFINEFSHSYGNENYIFNSEEENIYDLTVSYDNGQTFEPIDFAHYTILGKHTQGACIVRYLRDVSKNDKLKKYVYTILVVNCGMCESRDASMNWVLVPKIEDDYAVEFVVNHKRWNGGK